MLPVKFWHWKQSPNRNLQIGGRNHIVPELNQNLYFVANKRQKDLSSSIFATKICKRQTSSTVFSFISHTHWIIL